MPVLSRHEETGDQQDRSDHPCQSHAAMTRPENVATDPHQREGEQKGRQLRRGVVADVRAQLVDHAVAEIAREHRNVGVQVSVVLLEKVGLAAKRKGERNHEQGGVHPAGETAPPRRGIEQHPPDHRALDHRRAVGQQIHGLECSQPRPTPGKVRNHRNDRGRQQHQDCDVPTQTRSPFELCPPGRDVSFFRRFQPWRRFRAWRRGNGLEIEGIGHGRGSLARPSPRWHQSSYGAARPCYFLGTSAFLSRI